MIIRPSDGLGVRLAMYRRLAGLTAQALSDLMGGELSRGVIANIETGRKTDISVDQMIALAFALGVPFAALALPLDRPFQWVAVVRGTGPNSWESMRSAELLEWMTAKPEPFRAERKFGLQPAGIVARQIIRQLQEYNQIATEIVTLKEKMKTEPQYEEVLRDHEDELTEIEKTLAELGVDIRAEDP